MKSLWKMTKTFVVQMAGIGIFVATAHAQITDPAASGQNPTAPPSTPVTTPPPSSAPTSPLPSPSINQPTTGTAAPPLRWGVQALQESIAEHIAAHEPQIHRRVSKKSRLPERKIQQLRQIISRDEKNLSARIQLAEHFESRRDADSMIEVLRPAVARLNRTGFLALARAYRMKKDFKEEIRTLEILHSQFPKDHIVLNYLADAYVSYAKYEDGLNRYLDSKLLNPGYLYTHQAIYRERLRAKQFSDATDTLTDMINRFGPRADLLSDLCLLYAHQAYFDKALEVCRTAIRRGPKIPENHVYLGLVWIEKENVLAGEKILRQAAKQFSKSEIAQWALGELEWEKKNSPTALRQFRKAVKNNPASARAHRGRARAAFAEKNFGEALDAFVKTCQLNRAWVDDFRVATAQLRRTSNTQWSSRFEGGMSRCSKY